jgi:hypothetical protein
LAAGRRNTDVVVLDIILERLPELSTQGNLSACTPSLCSHPQSEGLIGNLLDARQLAITKPSQSKRLSEPVDGAKVIRKAV